MNDANLVSTSAPGRRFDAIVALVLAVGSLVVMMPTLGDYGMTWDEGFTVEREERLEEWFARVAGPDRAAVAAWSPATSILGPRSEYLRRAGASARSPWSRESLRFYWPFAREEPNGHPPFYALLGVAGWALSHHVLPPLESYRFGPALLFGLTVGAVYLAMARHSGRLAGTSAALALLTMPRVFAHAHLASYDAPLLCLWFLSVAAFEQAAARGGLWPLAFGAALGCAASTKLTGWFLPIPLAVWALLHRDLRAARALVIGTLVAAVVIVGLNPAWWFEPVAGLRDFLRSNLSRDQHASVPTMFLGRVYPYSLPWYNTLFITGIVVPPATLALALAGIAGVFAGRLRDRAGTLSLVCWVFLIVLRALPVAPGHDLERQFLPAFVFLACLAGLGAPAVRQALGRVLRPRRAGRLAVAVVAASLASGAWDTWRFHPLQLSYYNALIGGLSGASRAGMEATYYWDALTPDVRGWLNAQTPAGRSVEFTVPMPSFEYLHRWGLLRPPVLPNRLAPPLWHIVQNRAGTLRFFAQRIDGDLMDHTRPAFSRRLAAAPDVPLLCVFSIEDVLRAEAARDAKMGK